MSSSSMSSSCRGHGGRRKGSGRRKGGRKLFRALRLSPRTLEKYSGLKRSGHFVNDEDFVCHLLSLEEGARRRAQRSVGSLLTSSPDPVAESRNADFGFCASSVRRRAQRSVGSWSSFPALKTTTMRTVMMETLDFDATAFGPAAVASARPAPRPSNKNLLKIAELGRHFSLLPKKSFTWQSVGMSL